MALIDGDHLEQGLVGQLAKEGDARVALSLGEEKLGGAQQDAQVAARQRLRRLHVLDGALRRAPHCSGHVVALEELEVGLHQRDGRDDDQRRLLGHERREEHGDRLAHARRLDHDTVLAQERRLRSSQLKVFWTEVECRGARPVQFQGQVLVNLPVSKTSPIIRSQIHSFYHRHQYLCYDQYCYHDRRHRRRRRRRRRRHRDL